MRDANDYVHTDENGQSTITSLAYWLTPDGLNNAIIAALLRDAIETSSDEGFAEAFDSATKDEAREILAAYELCAMPYWGREELATMIHREDIGRDEALALRAVTLAQRAGELPDPFTPKSGVTWAMARGYLVSVHNSFLAVSAGVYGSPHKHLVNIASNSTVAEQCIAAIKTTARERRHVWLKAFEADGKRGAVQRVFDRERLLNPRADRSYIGKQILVAKKERDEQQKAGTWLTSGGR